MLYMVTVRPNGNTGDKNVTEQCWLPILCVKNILSYEIYSTQVPIANRDVTHELNVLFPFLFKIT